MQASVAARSAAMRGTVCQPRAGLAVPARALPRVRPPPMAPSLLASWVWGARAARGTAAACEPRSLPSVTPHPQAPLGLRAGSSLAGSRLQHPGVAAGARAHKSALCVRAAAADALAESTLDPLEK